MKALKLKTVSPLLTNRAQLLSRLAQGEEYDIAIIGGGATGLGTAVDAAARGLKVVLVEANDFAKGTSSRSTKLVHGGVRYLAQGHLPLVWEALRERKRFLENAPHLAHPLPFVMPAYSYFDQFFYGIGLKMYDLLAGKSGLGSTKFLSRAQTLSKAPGTQSKDLVGGVQYWDGQFDDSRLAVALARTAAAHGALLINHMPVTGLLTGTGVGSGAGARVAGMTVTDAETGAQHTVRAKCIINATGVWVDQIEALAASGSSGGTSKHLKAAADTTAAASAAASTSVSVAVSGVRPSQGVHIVVDSSFWPGSSALLVPKTKDGRVLFAVPWLGKVIVGTTDTPKTHIEWEPRALEGEVEQILSEAAHYLSQAPQRKDIRSIWAGLRPLAAKPQKEGSGEGEGATANVSREHTVKVAGNGLVSVTGGKWTTYRAMAADVIQTVRKARADGASAKGKSGKADDDLSVAITADDVTADLPLWGAPPATHAADKTPKNDVLASYGTDSELVQSLPGANAWLTPELSEAMVRFAARYEYARSVEDVLARRNRLLFLDAAAAARVAPQVAAILQQETGVSPQLEAFAALCKGYQYQQPVASL